MYKMNVEVKICGGIEVEKVKFQQHKKSYFDT